MLTLSASLLAGSTGASGRGNANHEVDATEYFNKYPRARVT